MNPHPNLPIFFVILTSNASYRVRSVVIHRIHRLIFT